MRREEELEREEAQDQDVLQRPDNQRPEPASEAKTTSDLPSTARRRDNDDDHHHHAPQPSSSPTDRLLPIRAFYFFYFASLATFVPFVSLYLRDSAPARLSAAQVGTVASLRPFVSAPAGVLLAAFADRRSCHAALLVAGHALCALARAALVPSSSSLAAIVLVTIAAEAAGGPVCVIADAAAVAEAGGLGYGSLRLWGAVGWGGMSLLSGSLLHYGGMGGATVVYLALALPALWGAARMPCDRIRKKKEEEKVTGGGDAASPSPPSPQPPSTVLQLLRHEPGVSLFLATACLFGVGVGAIGEFLFLHLRDALQAPEWLMGATLAVTCAAEVPAFRLQPRLLRALGVRAALRLVALAYVLRTALYAALPAMARALVPMVGGGGGGGGGGSGAVPTPATPLFPPYLLVLPVEVLHGLCFAVAWGAGCLQSRRAAPPGAEAELQGWFSGCFFGVGQGCGCLIAGALYSRLGGGSGMFAAVSGGLAVSFVFLEVLGARWPWAELGGAGAKRVEGEEEDETEEGAWLLEKQEGVRSWWRARLGAALPAPPSSSSAAERQRYSKLAHKNSDAELALPHVGGVVSGGA